MIDIPAGTATLGLSREARSFGWDNEFEENAVRESFYVIEISAAAAFDALGSTYDYLAIAIAAGGTSAVLGAANAILSSQRFAADQGATVLA